MANRSNESTAETGARSIRRSSAALPITGPNVTNVVCGMNLNCLLDLKTIALHARNVVYNPKRFPSAILRIREPKATALVFKKGKMLVMGTRSVDDARLASRKFARQLQKMGFHPKIEDFTVQNIVGHADTRMTIHLDGLRYEHHQFATYEPEIFPGLIYIILQPKMTVMVFASGKLVLLGAKKKEDLDEAMNSIYPVLRKHKK